MLVVAAAVVFAAAIAGLIYLRQEKLGIEGVGLAALRTVGFAAIILLLLNPSCTQRRSIGAPMVLLDRSLSIGAAGGQWSVALDTAGSIAGSDGTILGFGESLGPLTDSVPTDAVSRLREALMGARALGRPVTVITDGELSDGGALSQSLFDGVDLVLLARDSVPGAALAMVEIPERVLISDSIAVELSIPVWGEISGDTAAVELWVGDRRIVRHKFEVPQPPAVLRRQFWLPARLLGAGEHAIRINLTVDGDREMRDNVRQRVVLVTEQPGIVVIVDPAGWEGRFLIRVLHDVSGVPVRGFARVGLEDWLDMRSANSVSPGRVRQAVRDAGLAVFLGSDDTMSDARRRGPVWYWLSGDSVGAALQPGDWYVARDIPRSPLAAALARVEWDSLPPLTGIHVVEPDSGIWVAASAQLGRRGEAQPIVFGSGAGSSRELFTAGTGFWRWSFRGGASLEAVRTLLASGIDWLLESDRIGRGTVRLTSGPVVSRGAPLVLEWAPSEVPDSLIVRFGGETSEFELAFGPDSNGRAEVSLPPGVYRWSARGTSASGLVVVEQYSEEFVPRPASVTGSVETERRLFIGEVFFRQRTWFFLLAILVFCVEWGWRQRRGLP